MKAVKVKAQDKLWVKPSPVKKLPFFHRVSPHPSHWSFNVSEGDHAEGCSMQERQHTGPIAVIRTVCLLK